MFLGKYYLIAIMPYSKIYKDHLMEDKSVFKLSVNPKGSSNTNKMRGGASNNTNPASMMATSNSKMADFSDHALMPA